MQSEDKWLTNRNENSVLWNKKYKKQGYIEDTSLENEESPFKKLLIAGAIAIGGVAAYKSGLLKKPISQIMKTAGQYKGIAPTVTKTVKEWMGSSSNSLLESNSLFRARGFKDLIGRLNNKDFKNVLTRTRQDFSNLKKQIVNNTTIKKKMFKEEIKESFGKTDLFYNIANINYISDSYKFTQQRNRSKQIMINDLIEKFTQKPQDVLKKIKRTGHRQATLDDLIEYKEQLNGGFKFFNKNAEHKFDQNSLEGIEKFIKETKLYDNNGNVIKVNDVEQTLFNSGKWKDLMLDSNIFVDEANKISDLREISNTGAKFVRSLATDFQIPFVGLNPLHMIGLNKFAYKEALFGTLSKETAQPIITGKTGKFSLQQYFKDFSDSDMLYSNGKAYAFNNKNNDFEMIRDDIKLERIYPNSTSISKNLNDLSKIANLKTREYEKFTKKDGAFKYSVGKIADFLDLGSQDSTRREFIEGSYSNILSALDPSTYIEKGLSMIFGKNLFNKGHGPVSKISEVFGSHSLRQFSEDEAPLYIALKRNIKLKEVMNPESSETITSYFAQFLKGRDSLKEMNSGALFFYNLIERMNQALSPFGLALSQKSTASTASTISNLILKRFLPVYGFMQGVEYLNYLTERKNEDGEETNMSKDLAKGLVNIDIGLHKVGDTIGLNSFMKKLGELTPGNDHLNELPIINKLGIGRTADEQVEYYEKGMDAVRKGRYWALGNTAFTGDKINYYKPNWFKEKMADAEFTESKYGSRKEYFDNFWFPTPTSPLAPFRHFITDKYHYEEKHYNDRPYMMTSPQFEGVPVFGPVLSSTIGKIIKPQKRMHEEYWNASKNPKENLNVVNSYTVGYGDAYYDGGSISPDGKIGLAQYSNPNKDNITLGSMSTINPLLNDEQIKTLGAMPNLTDGKEVYTTASGQQQIVDINRREKWKIDKELKSMSIKKVIGAQERTKINVQEETINNAEIPFYELNPNNFVNTFTNQYKDSSNVFGIYGYIANTYATGDLGEGKTLMDTSGYAYSFRDKFWEQDFGGLGGDLSEIFRRFVQKRRTDVNYYNPVRNTMPEYLPGSEYFTDFKHGDPYQKLPKGEIRLPGEAYEKLWGITDPMKMEIGSSSLGKSKSDIVNHLLRNDTITDEDSLDIVQGGTKTHEKVQDMWLKNGLAIDTEGKVEDKVNNVVGYYDARIHDPNSKTGEAIVDIKTINQKGFDKVVQEGKAKELHQKQVNFYLWATGNEKGYVHYINRETQEKYTVGFEYDEEMLKDSFDTLNAARQEIKDKIDEGKLSRGDLYRPMDRYRILADVAPYSDEFNNMKAILSRSGLREEDKVKFDEINERVKNQKEANRTYEYKFKTANVDTLETKISKVDGQSIYVNFNGEERKINFSGISKKYGETTKERKYIENTMEELKSNLVEGASVKLKIDKDALTRDKIKGLKAVVYDNQGKNINRAMIKKGVALEDKEDYSPTSIHAKYTPIERAFGNIWETIAHNNSFINTKFLQVRSAKEDYERDEVYGKSFKTWEKPIQDYLMPSLYSAIERPGGVLVGALVGSWFGSNSASTKFGKLAGAILGAGSVLIGKAYKAGYEISQGENWIPEPRRKERDLNEYVDVLKYVKNQKLYNKYKEKAFEEDGFDLDAYLAGKRKQAYERKQETSQLEEQKSEIKEQYNEAKEKRDMYIENERPKREYASDNTPKGQKGIRNEELKEKYQREREKYNNTSEELKQKTRELKDDLKETNSEINENKSFRDIEILPENAMKALEYKANAEKTMYGYDAGDPLTNILSALPKKDRDRMKYFMKAPEEERERILELAPVYLKRPLQAAYGMKVDEKELLESYFTKHQLPGEDWVGWDESVDMDSIKVKMINSEGLSNSEFNVWDEDVNKAKSLGKIPLPNINYRSNSNDIKKRLMGMLNDYNIDNSDVSFTYGGNGLSIDFDFEHDKKQKIEQKINNLM